MFLFIFGIWKLNIFFISLIKNNCFKKICSLETWYYMALVLFAGYLKNAEVAVDALSIWYVHFFFLSRYDDNITYCD